MNTDTSAPTLEALAQKIGIEPHYYDIAGRCHEVPHTTLHHFLDLLGFPSHTPQQRQASLDRFNDQIWQRTIAPVHTFWQDQPLHIPMASRAEDLFGYWQIQQECGEIHTGSYHFKQLPKLKSQQRVKTLWQQRRLTLPVTLPPGYHQLTLHLSGLDGHPIQSRIIIAPKQAFQPPALHHDQAHWGFAIQLYALKSQESLGMGDFADLKKLLTYTQHYQGSFIGLNPLHALFLLQPEKKSPYSPSSRLFINPLYINLSEVHEFSGTPQAKERLQALRDQGLFKRITKNSHVDYHEVARIKWPFFELLFKTFIKKHVTSIAQCKAKTTRGKAFFDYCQTHSETLFPTALFDSLFEHFSAASKDRGSWQNWPEAYQDPHSEACHIFSQKNRLRICFYQYLYWLAEMQLTDLGRHCLHHGFPLGLYGDLALGADPDGAEVWKNPQSFVTQVRIGAPPDDFTPKGQEWGIPPLHPFQLQAQGYQPFIDLLRANMRHVGALRLDHAMSLARLFWIPLGQSADQGAYIRYPLNDLLAIVALESQRNHCLIIAEALGTVPKGFRERLNQVGFLSYHLFYFEKDHQNHFSSPEHYPQNALLSLSTHDLPTLAGWLKQIDITHKQRLKMFPDQTLETQIIQQRQQDIEQLFKLPHLLNLSKTASITTLSQAIHDHLGQSRSQLLAVQLEDLYGEEAQANLPGTVLTHANWCRKIMINLENFNKDERILSILQTVNQARSQKRQ
ncbi:4-alpha-glucanotransferase [Magnetococcales bacterium HHB-1]